MSVILGANSYVLGLKCLKYILFGWRSLLLHKKVLPLALKYLIVPVCEGMAFTFIFSGMKFSITVRSCVNKASSFIFH